MIEPDAGADLRGTDPRVPRHRASFLVLVVTAVLTRATGFLVLAVAYRLLERERLGLYFFGMSLASVLVLVTGLNMMPALVREIAVARKPFAALLGAFLVLRGLLGVVYAAAFVAAFWAMGYAGDGGALVLIALFILLEDIDATLANVLIARNRVRYHVISTAAAYAVLVVAFGVLLAVLGRSLHALILAQVLKTIVLVSVSLGLIHGRIDRLCLAVAGRAVAALARASAPFVLIALAAVSYRHILNFWLSGLGMLELAADFGLVFFVVNGLMFFTYINNSLLYPRVCRAPAGGRRIVRIGLVFNVVAGVVLAGLVTGLCAWLGRVAALADYAGVLDLLGKLVWVLPGMFLTAFVSMVLYGLQRERTVLAVGFGFLVLFTALSGIGLRQVGPAALVGIFLFTYTGQAVVLGVAYLVARKGTPEPVRGMADAARPS
ncbi:MAG: hypothetical protein JXQ29_13400 [Planctomycetes bacterium]|nr:hypothetical protein [Planctomycetota bacterium]